MIFVETPPHLPVLPPRETSAEVLPTNGSFFAPNGWGLQLLQAALAVVALKAAKEGFQEVYREKGEGEGIDVVCTCDACRGVWEHEWQGCYVQLLILLSVFRQAGKQASAGKCRQVQAIAGRCRQVQASASKCRQVRARAGRCRQVQASRQAGKQASRQAGKQASRQAGKQASRRAGKQASRRARRRRVIRTSRVAIYPSGSPRRLASRRR